MWFRSLLTLAFGLPLASSLTTSPCNPNPCSIGGQCYVSTDQRSYTCACLPDYLGPACSIYLPGQFVRSIVGNANLTLAVNQTTCKLPIPVSFSSIPSSSSSNGSSVQSSSTGISPSSPTIEREQHGVDNSIQVLSNFTDLLQVSSSESVTGGQSLLSSSSSADQHSSVESSWTLHSSSSVAPSPERDANNQIPSDSDQPNQLPLSSSAVNSASSSSSETPSGSGAASSHINSSSSSSTSDPFTLDSSSSSSSSPFSSSSSGSDLVCTTYVPPQPPQLSGLTVLPGPLNTLSATLYSVTIALARCHDQSFVSISTVLINGTRADNPSLASLNQATFYVRGPCPVTLTFDLAKPIDMDGSHSIAVYFSPNTEPVVTYSPGSINYLIDGQFNSTTVQQNLLNQTISRTFNQSAVVIQTMFSSLVNFSIAIEANITVVAPWYNGCGAGNSLTRPGSSTTSLCTTCPSGMYMSSVNAFLGCFRCIPGTFSSERATRCTACMSGFYQPNARASGCIVCPSGTSSSVGSSKCASCPVGTYYDAQSRQCRSCVVGTYNDEVGKSVCKLCPQRVNELIQITDTTGATSPAQCTVSTQFCVNPFSVPSAESVSYICSTHGSCVPSNRTSVQPVRYECSCTSGWSGDYCETPDFHFVDVFSTSLHIDNHSSYSSSSSVDTSRSSSVVTSSSSSSSFSASSSPYLSPASSSSSSVLSNDQIITQSISSSLLFTSSPVFVGVSDVNNEATCFCFNGGFCEKFPDNSFQCSCPDGFAGTSCEMCMPDHYGPRCLPCTSCLSSNHSFLNEPYHQSLRGHCDDGVTGSGRCICSPGWAGSACDQCSSVEQAISATLRRSVPLFGGFCNQTCPACDHGVCSSGVVGTGECVCNLPIERENNTVIAGSESDWSGPTCSYFTVDDGSIGSENQIVTISLTMDSVLFATFMPIQLSAISSSTVSTLNRLPSTTFFTRIDRSPSNSFLWQTNDGINPLMPISLNHSTITDKVNRVLWQPAHSAVHRNNNQFAGTSQIVDSFTFSAAPLGGSYSRTSGVIQLAIYYPPSPPVINQFNQPVAVDCNPPLINPSVRSYRCVDSISVSGLSIADASETELVVEISVSLGFLSLNHTLYQLTNHSLDVSSNQSVNQLEPYVTNSASQSITLTGLPHSINQLLDTLMYRFGVTNRTSDIDDQSDGQMDYLFIRAINLNGPSTQLPPQSSVRIPIIIDSFNPPIYLSVGSSSDSSTASSATFNQSNLPLTVSARTGENLVLPALHIRDTNIWNGFLTVNLSCLHGTILLSTNRTYPQTNIRFYTSVIDPTSNQISYQLISGNLRPVFSQASLSFNAPIDYVNAYLSNLQYRSNSQFVGTDSLLIQISDNGYTGVGGEQTVNQTIIINVVSDDTQLVMRSVSISQSMNQFTLPGDRRQPFMINATLINRSFNQSFDQTNGQSIEVKFVMQKLPPPRCGSFFITDCSSFNQTQFNMSMTPVMSTVPLVNGSFVYPTITRVDAQSINQSVSTFSACLTFKSAPLFSGWCTMSYFVTHTWTVFSTNVGSINPINTIAPPVNRSITSSTSSVEFGVYSVNHPPFTYNINSIGYSNEDLAISLSCYDYDAYESRALFFIDAIPTIGTLYQYDSAQSNQRGRRIVAGDQLQELAVRQNNPSINQQSARVIFAPVYNDWSRRGFAYANFTYSCSSSGQQSLNRSTVSVVVRQRIKPIASNLVYQAETMMPVIIDCVPHESVRQAMNYTQIMLVDVPIEGSLWTVDGLNRLTERDTIVYPQSSRQAVKVMYRPKQSGSQQVSFTYYGWNGPVKADQLSRVTIKIRNTIKQTIKLSDIAWFVEAGNPGRSVITVPLVDESFFSSLNYSVQSFNFRISTLPTRGVLQHRSTQIVIDQPQTLLYQSVREVDYVVESTLMPFADLFMFELSYVDQVAFAADQSIALSNSVFTHRATASIYVGCTDVVPVVYNHTVRMSIEQSSSQYASKNLRPVVVTIPVDGFFNYSLFVSSLSIDASKPRGRMYQISGRTIDQSWTKITDPLHRVVYIPPDHIVHQTVDLLNSQFSYGFGITGVSGQGARSIEYIFPVVIESSSRLPISVNRRVITTENTSLKIVLKSADQSTSPTLLDSFGAIIQSLPARGKLFLSDVKAFDRLSLIDQTPYLVQPHQSINQSVVYYVPPTNMHDPLPDVALSSFTYTLVDYHSIEQAVNQSRYSNHSIHEIINQSKKQSLLGKIAVSVNQTERVPGNVQPITQSVTQGEPVLLEIDGEGDFFAVILSLPQHGRLYQVSDNQTIGEFIDQTPIVVNHTRHWIFYQSDSNFTGSDSFSFSAQLTREIIFNQTIVVPAYSFSSTGMSSSARSSTVAVTSSSLNSNAQSTGMAPSEQSYMSALDSSSSVPLEKSSTGSFSSSYIQSEYQSTSEQSSNQTISSSSAPSDFMFSSTSSSGYIKPDAQPSKPASTISRKPINLSNEARAMIVVRAVQPPPQAINQTVTLDQGAAAVIELEYTVDRSSINQTVSIVLTSLPAGGGELYTLGYNRSAGVMISQVPFILPSPHVVYHPPDDMYGLTINSNILEYFTYVATIDQSNDEAKLSVNQHFMMQFLLNNATNQTSKLVSNVAYVKLSVQSTNLPPWGYTAETTVSENGAATVVLQYMGDRDPASLRAVIVSQPKRGKLCLLSINLSVNQSICGSEISDVSPVINQVIDGQFRVVYQPSPNQWGEDSFVWQMQDVNTGRARNNDTARIQVTHVNQAPQTKPTIVIPITPTSGNLPIELKASDPDPLDELTYEIVEMPKKGVLRQFLWNNETKSMKEVEIVANQPMINRTIIFNVNNQGSSYPYSSIVWKATDRSGASCVQSINLTITCPPGQVNAVFLDYGPLCIECPTGAQCSQLGAYMPFTQPGYWPSDLNTQLGYGSLDQPTNVNASVDVGLRSSSTLGDSLTPQSTLRSSLIYLPCQPASSCRGGAWGVDVDSLCTDGYHDRRCGTCVNSWYKSNGSCSKCRSSQSFWTTMMMYLLPGGAFISLFLLLVTRLKLEVTFFTIAVNFFQLLSTFSSFRLSWSNPTRSLFASVSFINFNVDLLSLECHFPGITYQQKWLVCILFPAVVGGLLLVFSHASALIVCLVDWVRTKDRRRQARDQPTWMINHAINPKYANNSFRAMLGRSTSAPAALAMLRQSINHNPPESNPHSASATSFDVNNSNNLIIPSFESPYSFKTLLSRQLHKNHSRFIWAYHTFLMIVFLSLAMKSFEMLKCSELPDGSMALDVEPSVRCDDPSINQWRYIAIVSVCMYVVGIPLWFCWVMFRLRPPVDANPVCGGFFHLPLTNSGLSQSIRRKRLSSQISGESGFLSASKLAVWNAKYSPLTKPFTHQYYYWSIIIIMRNLIIAIISIVCSNLPLYQGCLSLLTLALSLLLQQSRSPYRANTGMNELEMTALTCSICILFTGILFYAQLGPAEQSVNQFGDVIQEESSPILTALTLAFVGVFCIVMLALFWRQLARNWRHLCGRRVKSHSNNQLTDRLHSPTQNQLEIELMKLGNVRVIKSVDHSNYQPVKPSIRNSITNPAHVIEYQHTKSLDISFNQSMKQTIDQLGEIEMQLYRTETHDHTGTHSINQSSKHTGNQSILQSGFPSKMMNRTTDLNSSNNHQSTSQSLDPSVIQFHDSESREGEGETDDPSTDESLNSRMEGDEGREISFNQSSNQSSNQSDYSEDTLTIRTHKRSDDQSIDQSIIKTTSPFPAPLPLLSPRAPHQSLNHSVDHSLTQSDDEEEFEPSEAWVIERNLSLIDQSEQSTDQSTDQSVDHPSNLQMSHILSGKQLLARWRAAVTRLIEYSIRPSAAMGFNPWQTTFQATNPDHSRRSINQVIDSLSECPDSPLFRLRKRGAFDKPVNQINSSDDEQPGHSTLPLIKNQVSNQLASHPVADPERVLVDDIFDEKSVNSSFNQSESSLSLMDDPPSISRRYVIWPKPVVQSNDEENDELNEHPINQPVNESINQSNVPLTSSASTLLTTSMTQLITPYVPALIKPLITQAAVPVRNPALNPPLMQQTINQPINQIVNQTVNQPVNSLHPHARLAADNASVTELSSSDSEESDVSQNDMFIITNRQQYG